VSQRVPTATSWPCSVAIGGARDRWVDRIPEQRFRFKECIESFDKIITTTSGVEAGDPVQDFPDGDRRNANALKGDSIKENHNPWLWSRPHHFGNDIRVD